MKISYPYIQKTSVQMFLKAIFIAVFAVVLIPSGYAGTTIVASQFDKSELPKLRVIESNNYALDSRSVLHAFASSPDNPTIRNLRSMIQPACNLTGLSELVAIRKALSFVHRQWIHDSFNSVNWRTTSADILDRASKGERFTCVEYAKVLTDILISCGYPARMVGVSCDSIEIKISGARHVTVEVWSNSLEKWLFLDPQFGVMLRQGRSLINFYESARLFNRGSGDSINVIEPTEDGLGENPYPDSAFYKSFISEYSSYIDIPYVEDGKVIMLMLGVKDSVPPLLFQGTPLSGIEFSINHRLLYSRFNQTLMQFNYRYSVQSSDDPLSNAEYALSFSTSMPWLKQYEMRIDNEPWNVVQGNTAVWKLQEGINIIQARSRNVAGIAGRITTVKIEYNPNQQAP